MILEQATGVNFNMIMALTTLLFWRLLLLLLQCNVLLLLLVNMTLLAITPVLLIHPLLSVHLEQQTILLML